MRRNFNFALLLLMLLSTLGISLLTPAGVSVNAAPMTTFEPGIIASVRELSIAAGPMRQMAVLSPSGSLLLHHQKRQLCVYDLTVEPEAERFCTSYEDLALIPDFESFVWSPDERYVAFNAEFFRYFENPGLWLLEVSSGELRQLSGGSDVKLNFLKDEPLLGIDISPTWQPDSSGFYFVHYLRNDEVDYLPYLYHYDLAAQQFEEIRLLQPASRFGIIQLRLHQDGQQILYNVEFTDDKTQLGLWVSDIQGNQPARKLLPAREPVYVARTISFSADGTLLLTKNSSDGLYNGVMTPDQSPVHIVDLATGEYLLVDSQLPVRYAGWSPKGDSIAYIVIDPATPENSGLYLRSTFSAKPQKLLTGRFIPPTPESRQPILWAQDDTILLASAEIGFKLVLVKLNMP